MLPKLTYCVNLGNIKFDNFNLKISIATLPIIPVRIVLVNCA